MEIKYIKKTEISSTNLLASSMLKSGKIVDTTVVYTNFQSKGKGLGENTWISQENKNLLFTLVVFPDINIEDHFNLNMIISLAICDYLNLKGVLAKIKWPNDIYVKNHKIAGMLVENNLYGDIIRSSIIGVGLNLNQTEFTNELSNPISLKKIIDIDFNIDDEVQIISKIISNNIRKYKNVNFDKIKLKYLRNLYRLNIESKFKIEDKIIVATIIDVKKDGYLVIIDNKLQTHEFWFKEIEYII